ncbi:MAG: HD domain-containing protein [Ferruginibacter sp.]
MVNLPAIRSHVTSMLTAGLPKDLVYHDVHHTLDVTANCMIIAREEGLFDEQVLLELEIASLYHDTGFIFIYNGHEKKSCDIAREQLPEFGVGIHAIDNICSLIMATKIPQTPKTDLQKIICDADLDYLGRDDFFETSEKLRTELLHYKLIRNEDWEKTQIDFLQNHQYFTVASRKKRTAAKIAFIKQLVETKNIHLK